jgi:predicted dinucleotide-utilizing enzyme
MHIIFGKAHVDGSTTACPRDISSDNTSDEDVAEVPKPTKEKKKIMNQGKRKRKAIEEKEEKSPFFRMYKNTCLKIESAAERISTSVEASSAPTINQIPTIAEAVKMVKECGVEEGTALMYMAWSALANPEFREFFGSLETNKGRLDLIQREHEMEKNKKEGSN